jgi:hypothetical protein
LEVNMCLKSFLMIHYQNNLHLKVDKIKIYLEGETIQMIVSRHEHYQLTGTCFNGNGNYRC